MSGLIFQPGTKNSCKQLGFCYSYMTLQKVLNNAAEQTDVSCYIIEEHNISGQLSAFLKEISNCLWFLSQADWSQTLPHQSKLNEWRAGTALEPLTYRSIRSTELKSDDGSVEETKSCKDRQKDKDETGTEAMQTQDAGRRPSQRRISRGCQRAESNMRKPSSRKN